ncbi:hypothetical protein ACJMK2_029212 [Sinanodonta woodiana]|uniref:pyridoxal kinase n=1 Tax=Sinanodonta woodiana TaxID=1069815 RepID=A0ABD3XDC6_SINWO
MSDLKQNEVLSIQSTVVYGFVGNKCATFTLQVLGFSVSPINSVQLSNHTGYQAFQGQVLNADDVECLYEGLKKNNINNFSHLLTGYIGSKSFLEKVADIIKDLRSSNSALYVPAELMPVYRDVIVPLADIVTPNQFEAELLTGMKINTEKDALQAMQILHDKGPMTVVISSTNLGTEGVLVALASSVRNGKKECYRMEMPYLPAVFVGTGDVFAACLLAWMHHDNDLKLAFEKTVASVQAVIQHTLDAAKASAGPNNKPSPYQMELRLIQSKKDIENPHITIYAVPL